MSGFAFLEIEIDTPPRGPVRVPEGVGGIGLVLRDRGAIVDFRLIDRADLAAGTEAAALVTPAARAAALCSRLRDQIALPGTAHPTLSVVICTRDRPDGLARLLASLVPEQARWGFEIVVVDNASDSDAPREVAAAHDGVRYVREPLAGLDFARNRGLREATGDVVAYLDDDVTVEPGWTSALLDAWARNPDAGAVTALVMPMSLETEAQVLFERRGGFRRGHRPLRHGPRAYGDPLHPAGAGKFGAGASMSFDRALIVGLGGFDEALDTGRPLPGGGDIDMFYRVLRAGRMLIYEPRAVVRHDHRRDLAGLRHQYYTWGLGFAAFLVKSMRTDPGARGRLRGMALWWFGYKARRVAGALAGRCETPLAMVWAELWGGIKGFAGEYGRSQARVALIRARAT